MSSVQTLNRIKQHRKHPANNGGIAASKIIS